MKYEVVGCSFLAWASADALLTDGRGTSKLLCSSLVSANKTFKLCH